MLTTLKPTSARFSGLKTFIKPTLFLSVFLWVYACQSTTPGASLDVEFGTCLGEIGQENSCGAQIFQPLIRGEIACWSLSASGQGELASGETLKLVMRWDGQKLQLSNPLALAEFPFLEGDRVDMRLAMFDSLETAQLCETSSLEPSCEEIPGCIAKITRRNTPITFGETMSFKNELNTCTIETPSIVSVELCNDGVDSDCDGIIDEGCLPIGECIEGEVLSCQSMCGFGEQRCQSGVLGACSAAMPSLERCTPVGEERRDEDCDGMFDEGCDRCTEGQSRSCQNACGVEGQEYCQGGYFMGCDAPLVNELCDGVTDEDCDGMIDEGCSLCIDGQTRPCESRCGIGVEICAQGSFVSCDARMPIEEVCENDLDDDCDGLFDEECPCVPSIESCDGADNDCDFIVDEETVAGTACETTWSTCAGSVPGVLKCDETGMTSCEPALGQFMVGDEVCDHVDNDCDGLVDEVIGVGAACAGEIRPECAYSRAVCTPGRLGEPVGLVCVSQGAPAEICNGADEDCDGRTDEGLDQSTACVGACGLAGIQRCINGQISCELTLPLPTELCDGVDNNCNGEIDEGCPTCSVEEERCDGQDDDCDQVIDEGVCGELIYQSCEARLAWWYHINDEQMLTSPNPPWSQWPPLSTASMTCPTTDFLNESTYSCDVTRAGSFFQMINIGTDNVGDRHWIGIGWSCEADSTLTLAEQNVVDWAHQYCHLAIGYKDFWGVEILEALDPENCPQSAPKSEQFRARCAQTASTSTYSAIELEGRVNNDDNFSLAFYCEENTPLSGFNSNQLAHRIQSEFQVFLAISQSSSIVQDGAMNIDGVPIFNRDNSSNQRGSGTQVNGQFYPFRLNQELRQSHQFGILTQVRP